MPFVAEHKETGVRIDVTHVKNPRLEMIEDRQWAILLDLDQTLILTAALTDLRRERKWSQVYASFHLTTLPTGTQAFLQAAERLAPLGIITTSPRPYAEKLVAYHRCHIPVVIAYHDTPRQKPFPDPLLLAARKLHVVPTNCFYIGDTLDDIAAARRAGVIPIGLCWDGSLTQQVVSGTCPLCENWNEVLQVIRSILPTKERRQDV